MPNNNQSQVANRRSIEQDRAKQAWDAIKEMRGTGAENDYGSRAKDLPSMLQVNGLGATMAFLRAKAGKKGTKDYRLHEDRLYKQVSRRVTSYLEYDEQGDLIHLIQNEDTETYRRATAEAIAFSIWLKRYCEAEGWKASGS